MTTKIVPPRALTPQMKIDLLERRVEILENRKGGVGTGSPPPLTSLKGCFLWNSHPDEIPDGAVSVPFRLPFGGSFTSIVSGCGIPATGGTADFDVTLNGISILGSHITFAASATSAADVTPTTTAFNLHDLLQIACGSAYGILDVIIAINYTRT